MCVHMLFCTLLLLLFLHVVIMWMFFILFLTAKISSALSLRLAMNHSPSRKSFPSGVSNFKQILKDKSFYVDKTIAIQQFEKTGRYLKLWRPRRCGKSLICDQLALYYDKFYADSTYFDDYYIGQNPTPDRAKYLVLRLSFSNVAPDGDIAANFKYYINAEVEDFIIRYSRLLHTDPNIIVEPNNHLFSLIKLFRAVSRAREEVYLIIDEYDSFANQLLMQVDIALIDLGFRRYKSMVADKESLLRSFDNVLKDACGNGCIARMFFTGVAPLAFSDGLSSLNIAKDISMDNRFEETYGFTESEVKLALENIFPSNATDVINSHFDIMRENFNGYRFNKDQQQGIFNPQMALYYLDFLLERGVPPEKLRDPSIATRSDTVASFLIENYLGLESLGALDFVMGNAGLSAKMDVSPRAADLFDMYTVDDSLRSLAYYHGYLTFGDPSADAPMKGLLYCPNKVFRDILIETIRAQYETVVIRMPKTWALQLQQGLAKASSKENLVDKLSYAAISSLISETLDRLLIKQLH